MSSSPTEVVSTLVDVLMPKMGSSVVEGTLVAWQVAVGDPVTADQALCVISTDKVDSDCPSPASGTLAEILVAEGETVDVGTVIARVAAGDADAADHGGANGPNAGTADNAAPDAARGETDRPGSVGGPGSVDGPGSAGEPRAVGEASVAGGSATPPAAPTRREILRRSSPVAAKIAAEHGIDITQLSGRGRNGRVTKADVLDEVARRAAAPAAPAAPAAADEPPMHIESPYRRDPRVPVAGAAPVDGTVVPLDRMRTAISAQMRRALDTAAHATTIVECDMSRIERQRRELGTTALPLVARHLLDTLRDFPALNATFDGQTLTRYDRVHLGIAVALGEDGLIVPVIHDAQELAPAGLASRIRDVAGRARAGELTADDVRGGTFTITNPGAAGALIATPIINVPQVAILDLEAIVKRPVVVTDADGQDSIAIRPMTHLCMSWDHRVIDGVYAARFLTALRGRIEGR